MRRALLLDEPVPLTLPDGSPSGLRCTAFAVPGKVPLYLEPNALGDADAPAIEEGERTVGLMLEDAHARLFFIPGCAAMSPRLAERLRGAAIGLVRRHAVAR